MIFTHQMRVQKLTISHCIILYDIKIKKYLTSKSSLLALVGTGPTKIHVNLNGGLNDSHLYLLVRCVPGGDW